MTKKAVLAIILVVTGIIIVVQLIRPTAPKPSQRAVNYNAHQICTEAWKQNQDHANENEPYYDITLTEGCFGPLFRPPKAWHNWYYQPLGDTTDYWIALWYQGREPVGPYGPNDQWNFQNAPIHWRLQGRGQVRIYSNDIVADASGTPEHGRAAPELPGPNVRIEAGDPRQCGGKELNTTDFPDPHYNKYLKPPKVLFSGHEADTIQWPRDFKGTIPVCFVVGVDGLAKDIRLLQSPGKEFEEKIALKLGAARWESATLRETHQGTPVPVPITVEMNFIFK